MTPGDLATQLTDLIRSECDPLDATGRRIVANRIAEAIAEWRTPEKPAEVEPLVPFTMEEARAFGRERVPFGQTYFGEPWNAVPLDRLAWYADTARENWRNLWRYLHSDYVRREQTNEED